MVKRAPIETYCEKKISTLQKNAIGMIDYVDISSVDNTKKKIISFQTMNTKDAPSRAKQLLKKYDILVSTVRPNLNAVAVVESETDNLMVGSTGYCVLRCKENMDFRYLFNFCQSQYFIDDMSSQATGASYPAVSTTIVRSSLIPCYPVDEQRKIASELDKITDLIDKRKEQLEKLDALVKARFVELFVDKDFPKTTIGELVASKVSSVKKVFLPTDTIKYIDISSIDNKRNIMTGFTEYVLEDAPSRAQQHIRKGDIIVSTVRPNLKNVAITGYDYDNLVASSGFCVLRAEKCLPSYLMAVVCSDDFTDAMTKVVTGANYPAIKDSDVKNYVVPNPPVELQEQFATFVEQTDKSKLEVQKSLEKLEVLKKALMQKYFG